MKYWLLPSLWLAVGYQSSDAPTSLNEAVAAHLPAQHSPRQLPAVAPGHVRKWRQVDDAPLAILQARAREFLVKTRWLWAHTERYSTLPDQYSDSTARLLDSLLDNGIRFNKIASKYDATRRGTQVAHTCQLRTATGKLVYDSAQFLVPRRGPMVQLLGLRPLF
ncbi:hypothetical protein [Hymenobacter negativus]|uniref:Uncharacterized protein n=1 Tax=Hymenobacter negativus TaxID=2795026 RepID=A0ABS3QQK1_9BACT|nr:hypothetical protein [Hymenobacter negativus]MBO2012955.1 hypothetical protein [Hymenobacter negativus]